MPERVAPKRVSTSGDDAFPAAYVPTGLTKTDRKKQIQSIRKKTDRPMLASFTSRRSSWVTAFEKKYGQKITNTSWIAKHIMKKEGIQRILDKGMAAYYTSGSRPNQSKYAWAFARLASVIMGGPARRIDRSVWDKFRI